MNKVYGNRKALIEHLKEKALWVRKETLKIHRIAPETRIASSLSDIEIFVALYYGDILKFDPNNTDWKDRDRFIISKGHGAISLYPILADYGFFSNEELQNVCRESSFLGGIPDIIVPGFETTNGSLGHGLGVACGISIALKRNNSDSKVFVLLGDGELYEGSVWEAIMFAPEHKLDNLIVIVDNNKISMLDYSRNIMDISPLEDKFRAFKWHVKAVNGHDVEDVYTSLINLINLNNNQPKVLIADTVKGRGVSQLENDSLCHIKTLEAEEIDNLLKELK